MAGGEEKRSNEVRAAPKDTSCKAEQRKREQISRSAHVSYCVSVPSKKAGKEQKC